MWSKLEGTEIWKRAEAAYGEPEGRFYHSMDHVRRLYEIAEETGLVYTPVLDLAILAHDVIYDAQPRKEQRSANWLIAQNPKEFTRTEILAGAALINTTIYHYPCLDNRLILLDLHDLGDPDIALVNRDLIAREADALYGVGREEFLTSNSAFMNGLARRIERGLWCVPEKDEIAFRRIVNGIHAVFGDPGPSPT